MGPRQGPFDTNRSCLSDYNIWLGWLLIAMAGPSLVGLVPVTQSCRQQALTPIFIKDNKRIDLGSLLSDFQAHLGFLCELERENNLTSVRLLIGSLSSLREVPQR